MILAKQCTRRDVERTFGDASDSICSIIELPFRSFGLFAARPPGSAPCLAPAAPRTPARQRGAALFDAQKKRNQIKRY